VPRRRPIEGRRPARQTAKPETCARLYRLLHRQPSGTHRLKGLTCERQVQKYEGEAELRSDRAGDDEKRAADSEKRSIFGNRPV
jgi:hypothetical protein